MAQQHGAAAAAAAAAFQSDIAHAPSRRASDTPLHPQVQASKGGAASVPSKKAKGKVQ